MALMMILWASSCLHMCNFSKALHAPSAWPVESLSFHSVLQWLRGTRPIQGRRQIVLCTLPVVYTRMCDYRDTGSLTSLDKLGS